MAVKTEKEKHCSLLCVYIYSPVRTLSRDEAVEELRRGEGPTSIIIDVLRLEFNIVNLLLTNDLLQASHHRVVRQ